MTTPLLIATCDGCGAPGGVLHALGSSSGHYQCPKCLKRLALEDGALEHLQVLVEAAVALWVQTWGEEFRIYATSDLHRVVERMDAQLGGL